MSVEILYRDAYYLVCNKPVGMLSESPGLPDELARQESLTCLYPVHRLDQVTGGVMILARTTEACRKMQESLLSGTSEKDYLVIVSGIPEENEGIMEDFLFHDKRNNKTYIVRHERKGVKKAVLYWKHLKTVRHGELQYTLIHVSLHTGRTHQIRIQFASRGMPLIGDKKYGSRIAADNIALWSYRSVFSHPYTKCPVTVEAVPPATYPWSLFSV